MATLTQKYKEMKTNVAADYHNSQFTEKGLSFVNLDQVSYNNNELTFEVKTGTGDKSDGGGFGHDGPFDEEDYWWYGEDMGHCDWTGTTDAAQQLCLAMNNDIPDPNGQYYFTNQTSVIRRGGDNNVRRPNDVLDNNYDYYLYSTRTDVNPPFHQYNMLCLEPTEMNTYFSYLKYLLYMKIPSENFPPGYAVICVDNMMGTFEGIGNEDKHYYLKRKFIFGLKVFYSPGSNGSAEL